ncbi:UNKNOWN [Stylonychia lemnae]|uniref:Uncharacterized protein n=1 Tax=Stylonychia lemnae TaxID=5949 RepID=A0A078AQ07_STYLE|nr:UNKNOWN [Stylonychia lemnae]|eukprot:CDW83028.1 UNKNOWN [Stylonychia lemnae]
MENDSQIKKESENVQENSGLNALSTSNQTSQPANNNNNKLHHQTQEKINNLTTSLSPYDIDFRSFDQSSQDSTSGLNSQMQNQQLNYQALSAPISLEYQALNQSNPHHQFQGQLMPEQIQNNQYSQLMTPASQNIQQGQLQTLTSKVREKLQFDIILRHKKDILDPVELKEFNSVYHPFITFSIASMILCPISGYQLYKFIQNNNYGSAKFGRAAIVQAVFTFFAYRYRLKFDKSIQKVESKYLNHLDESYIINFQQYQNARQLNPLQQYLNQPTLNVPYTYQQQQGFVPNTQTLVQQNQSGLIPQPYYLAQDLPVEYQSYNYAPQQQYIQPQQNYSNQNIQPTQIYAQAYQYQQPLQQQYPQYQYYIQPTQQQSFQAPQSPQV